MFKWASTSTSGIEVIFIVLLGCLFLCQTLGKLIMWIVGHFKVTGFNGKEIIEDLKKRNKLEEAKIKVSDYDFRSSFYSYKKKDNEFVINKFVADHSNAAADMFSLQAIAYANEKNNRSLQSRWQIIGVGLLSILPYLFFIGTMLLIYLPEHSNTLSLAMKYYIPVEFLSVVGWVLILVTLFWWMSIIQGVELAVEDLAKQLDNRNILDNVNSYLKLASYIPFSFRTII